MSKREASLSYFVLRRAAMAVPLMLAVVVINFTLIRLAPGDPATILAGGLATPATVATIRQELGLGQPYPVQLYNYLIMLLHGNFGYSYTYNTPVLTMLLYALPNTLILMVAALAIAYTVGIILGVYAAVRPYSRTDNVLSTFALALYSIPWFWLGLLLILGFAFFIPIFPIGGMQDPRNPGGALDVAYHLVLPAITLSGTFMGVTMRLVRSAMIDTLGMNYITFARAKGVADNRIIFRHALRNAILGPLSVMGVQIALSFGGATVVETVFGWPGMGRLIFNGLQARDYPLVLGAFVLMSFFAIIASLAVDIIYALLDPRIRYRK